MNCLIVDDDDIVRAEVEHFIKKTPFLNLVASHNNARDAYHTINESAIDLIFLDVMMPEMTGLELIKILGNKHPQIILMTLEKNYAVEAFECDVTDFLVKPFSLERFLKAATKANSHFNAAKEVTGNQEYIFVKADSGIVKINVNEILFVQGMGNYIAIITLAKKFVVHITMQTIMDKLPARDFIRVHLSYIVRIDKINDIDGTSTIMIEKNYIPIGRSYKDEFIRRINLV